MINLKELGYPNVNELYLFDFVPGCGGDFFITLASKCSSDFVNCWENDLDMETRMAEFRETKLMPGNNIGGKLIYYDTIGEYKQQILADLYRIGGSDATKMSFCTHPTGNNVNTRITDVLADCFPDIPIKCVALCTQSLISKQFTLYHYYDLLDFDGYYLDTLQDEHSRFIRWLDPENTLLIDHINLLINDPVKFKQAVLDITGPVSLNWNWYTSIIETYTEYKVDEFLVYYRNTFEEHGA